MVVHDVEFIRKNGNNNGESGQLGLSLMMLLKVP